VILKGKVFPEVSIDHTNIQAQRRKERFWTAILQEEFEVRA